MSTTSEGQIISCQNCGANNRIKQNHSSQQTPVCGRCKAPLSFNSQPLQVTDRNYGTLIENSPLPVLLDLWAPWCGPCRMLAPIVEQISIEMGGKFRVGKLNVDENPQTAARFRVQGIPTMLILVQGREIDRIVGVQSKEAILMRLNSVL